MPAISVSQLSAYIFKLIKRDRLLKNVAVEGEVSNLSNSGGIIYFALKDKDASISAIIFRDKAIDLGPKIEDGQKLIVKGSVSTYEKGSKYQIVVSDIEFKSKGEIYEKYLKLKKDLAEEGLFDKEIKKPIKDVPSKIGLITSKNGAAYRDVLNILRKKFPYGELHFFPTKVQGIGASGEIIRAIDFLESLSLDLIIITRGGGSFEDLFEFSNEALVRRVHESKTPIAAAIGHEVDESLIELAADLRAATPTEVAELVFPSKEAINDSLSSMYRSLNNSMATSLEAMALELSYMKRNLDYKSPESILKKYRTELDQLELNLSNSMGHLLMNQSNKIKNMGYRLEKHDLKETLKRGFAIVEQEGQLVASVKEARKNRDMKIFMYDGEIISEVKEKVEYED